MRLGVLATHPIQYHAPLYRVLAMRLDLHVYFAHKQTAKGQAEAGFGVEFEWDVPLLDGYDHTFLVNRASKPNPSDFFGCSTPEIAGIIRDLPFDAFLVNGWYNRSFFQAIRAAWRSDTPLLVRGDSHLATPRSRLKRVTKEAVYRWFIPRFDRFLVVGERSREYYLHYGADEGRIHFAPHYVDNEWFSKRARNVNRQSARESLGIREDSRVALFVGKFIDVKRPLDLLRAIDRLDEAPAWEIIFVGSGPLSSELERAARSSSTPIHFAGFKNQSELPFYYALADVLVLPSEAETWGLVVNEAMACGTPAVVSDAVGCAPDLIEEGVTGYTFPVGDIEALAHRLRSVSDLRDRPVTQEALKRKMDVYSVHRAADGIIEAMVAENA